MKENWLVTQDFFITNPFKSALKELFFLKDFQILLVYDNGICQVYDLITKKMVFEEKIAKKAQHLEVSQFNSFAYSDPLTKELFYTKLINPFKKKFLLEMPSKNWFSQKFEKEMAGLSKLLQEQLIIEIFETSKIKFLRFEKNYELLLIFECMNSKSEEFINKISIFILPEGKFINEYTIVYNENLSNSYSKFVENDYVILCPNQNVDNNNQIIILFFLNLKSESPNSFTQISINSFYPGQILGYHGFYSFDKMILSVFWNKYQCSIPKLSFIEINFSNFENINAELNKKFISLSNDSSNIVQISEENYENKELSKFFMIILSKKLIFYVIQINYSNLEIEKINSFEIKLPDIAYNPSNKRYCIEYRKEYYEGENDKKINQKYFKLTMFGCDSKLALLFILEKKKIIEKYGRHIAYEIIDFLI